MRRARLTWGIEAVAALVVLSAGCASDTNDETATPLGSAGDASTAGGRGGSAGRDDVPMTGGAGGDLGTETALDASAPDGSAALCGASDPTPVCSIAGGRGDVDVCVSPWNAEVPVTGTIVSTDAGCSFRSSLQNLRCEPSHLQIATDAGTVAFGICVPGGFTPPPVGSVISIDRTQGGDYCESDQSVTVRDGEGKLLLRAVQNSGISVPEISSIESTPVCRTSGAEYYQRSMALTITVGSETGTLKGGESMVIGDLDVAVHEASDLVFCDGDSECGYTHNVIVVRPTADVLDASLPDLDASTPLNDGSAPADALPVTLDGSSP